MLSALRSELPFMLVALGIKDKRFGDRFAA